MSQCEDPDQTITEVWYLLPVTLHHVWLVTDRSIAMICIPQFCRKGLIPQKMKDPIGITTLAIENLFILITCTFSVAYLPITANNLVENISYFQQLTEAGNSDRQAHSIIYLQQVIKSFGPYSTCYWYLLQDAQCLLFLYYSSS